MFPDVYVRFIIINVERNPFSMHTRVQLSYIYRKSLCVYNCTLLGKIFRNMLLKMSLGNM